MHEEEHGEQTPHRDTQGYYRVLRVATDAATDEIQLAYEMLTELPDEERGVPMAEIERAYSILMNPSARLAYDRVCKSPERLRSSRRRRVLDDWRVLVASITILFGILTFVWYPLYGNRLKSFVPGDRLVDLKGELFGVVVESSEQHTFPGGLAAEGYLIELTDSGELRWFPAADIHATCSRAD